MEDQANRQTAARTQGRADILQQVRTTFSRTGILLLLPLLAVLAVCAEIRHRLALDR